MTSKAVSRWETFWNERDDAGHRNNDAQWLQFYAAELLLFAPSSRGLTVEIGCGRGDLYPYIRRADAGYVGIDFSAAMTSAFAQRYRAAQVVRATATELPVADAAADFVFSNQVAQYLDAESIRANLRDVSRILSVGGIYLMANIPDADLRWAYRGHGLRNDRRFSLISWVRATLGELVLRRDDGIGLWYTRRAIAEFGKNNGYAVETYSSASYEYRFHAVFKRRGAP